MTVLMYDEHNDIYYDNVGGIYEFDVAQELFDSGAAITEEEELALFTANLMYHELWSTPESRVMENMWSKFTVTYTHNDGVEYEYRNYELSNFSRAYEEALHYLELLIFNSDDGDDDWKIVGIHEVK